MSPGPPTSSSNNRTRLLLEGEAKKHCRVYASILFGALTVFSPLSAASESTSSLVALATSYEHGEGVPKDPVTAAALYCEAAHAGDAEAQFRLGWMYANARGLERDDAAAASLFKRAAKQGHEYAKRMLQYVRTAGERLPECMRAPQVRAHWLRRKRQVALLVQKLAPEYSIRPQLALAIIEAESNFDPRARSKKNAQGLMQLLPDTAKRFGVRNNFDPNENVRGGLAYLRWLLSYYRGNVEFALAAYNAGEQAVDRFGGVPPFAETRSYVRRVMTRAHTRQHPFDGSLTEASPILPAAASRGSK